MKSVPAITLDVRPSRWLLAAVVAVLLLTLAGIALCGLNGWLKAGLAIGAVAYTISALKVFLHPPFVQVTWHSAGYWRLRDAADQQHVAQLQRAVVLGALIVLVLRIAPQRSIALTLLPDNCDAETQRRLRVRLARADAIETESQP
jgi:hypothetical protein